MTDPDITDADVSEVLKMFTLLPAGSGLLGVSRLAHQLGCDETVARAWLEKVVSTGHIVGPIFAGFENGEWCEVGYGLTAKGRGALMP
jgi:hypothetical protein